MKFKKGDSVAVIDDIIKGKVVKVKKNTVIIETSDGFPFEFSVNELVLIEKDQNDLARYANVSNAELMEKNEVVKKKKSIFKTDSKNKSMPIMEVDLHIEKLVKSPSKMDNFDKLEVQLNTAKTKLDYAVRNRILKVVLIHGVGEGVLKAELNNLLNKYDCNYQPASFQKYGMGATEVRFFQN